MQMLLMLATLAAAGQVEDRYLASPAEQAAAAPTESAPAESNPAPDTSIKINPSAVLPDASAAVPPAASEAFDPRTPAAGTGAEAPPAAPPADVGVAAERSALAAAIGPKPSELIRTLLKPPAIGALAGVPMTLGEAVRTAPTRQHQTERAKTYWQLATAVGEYNLAVLERVQIRALRPQNQIAQQAGGVWDLKLRELDQRAELARTTAQAAQMQLQQLVGGASLPLPADFPHCGRYNTEYAEIFKAQPNLAAKQLDQLMPLRYEQLRSQAAAITEAHDWLNQVIGIRDAANDGTGILHAYDLLSLRRRAFLATARDYNQEIVAYTEMAAPDNVGADRLVAMMIRTSGSGAAPWERSVVTPTSANEAETAAAEATTGGAASRGSESQGSPPRTFVRRPFQRLFREKSIVVRRLPLLRRDRNQDRNDRDQ